MATQGIPPAVDAMKGQRGRSYPSFGLAEALRQADKLFERAKRTFVPIQIACGYWGYSHTGSTGLRCVATMISYGLVDDSGTGANRQLKLSDLGYELVRNPKKDSPDYVRALKEAALTPAVLREVYEHYAPHEGLPPDDQALSWDLERKFRINPAGLRPLIGVLRETFALADVFGEIKAEQGSNDATTASDAAAPASPWNDSPTMRPAPSTPAVHGGLNMATAAAPGVQLRDQPLTLLSAGDAVLRYPHPMTEEDFDWLLETLRRLKKKLVATSVAQPPT